MKVYENGKDNWRVFRRNNIERKKRQKYVKGVDSKPTKKIAHTI